MTPALSVLLPAYNAEKTIALAIQSILNQTFRDFELIILEDGSTDQTHLAMQSLNDPRMRIISDGANKGLTARLNQGVDLARAPLIARMDADDVSFPDRFEKQMAFMAEHPEVDVVSARAIIFNVDTHAVIGMPPFCGTHEDLTRKPWGNIYMIHPTWMMRTAWARKNRYRLGARSQDQDLLLRALPTSRYACMPDVLLGYAQGPYDRRKVLGARIAITRAKAEIFYERGQYKNIFNLFALTAVKIAVDYVAAIPGLDYLFFCRMQRGGECPPDAVKTLQTLLGGHHGTSEKTSPHLQHTVVDHGFSA